MLELVLNECVSSWIYSRFASSEKGGWLLLIVNDDGILKTGDYIVAERRFGKVTSIVDSYGAKLKEVGPSVPVVVAGFETLPKVGTTYEVVPKEKFKLLKSLY